MAMLKKERRARGIVVTLALALLSVSFAISTICFQGRNAVDNP
jgi:hypothetical protein